MSVTACYGVLLTSFNTLCRQAAKSRETFNQTRNELLRLNDQFKYCPKNMVNDGCDVNVVKTKGTPKMKILNKNRKCSNCKQTGHIKSTCPLLVCIDDEDDLTQ